MTEVSAAPAATAHEDFVAMAAHELRAPATVIGAAAETLQQLIDPSLLDPRARELLAMILRNARQLRKLSADLLSTAYLERGELPMALASLPLLPIIGWAVEASRAPSGAVRVDCPPDLLATVDADHLERVLTNLVANACDHGAPPIVVSARARANSDGRTITVRDFGPGVPVDGVESLFEPFSRLAVHSPSSTGLGLSIARTLAREMGGDLRYRRATPGSAFVLTLRAA